MVTELKDTADTVFHDKFQRWRKSNPRGIFLTVESKAKANLHGSECHHLGSTDWMLDNDSHSLTKKLKVLGDGRGSLRRWVEQHSGTTIHHCDHCLRDKLIDEFSLGFISTMDHVDENHTIEAKWDREIFARTDIGATQKEALVNARRGQGLFRERVIKLEKRCRVTSVELVDHLRASHIKPWALSSDAERLDGNNGLLLAPHIDHLFDRGYISFKDTGDLILSTSCPAKLIKAWGIDDSVSVGAFRPAQLSYLAHHREHVLKQ